MKSRVMIATASRHQSPLILKAKGFGFEVLATDGCARNTSNQDPSEVNRLEIAAIPALAISLLRG